MPFKSLIPERINPDLEKERRTASFNIEEFQIWWHGGVDKLAEKREIENFVFKDSDPRPMHDYLSHEELYHQAVKDVTEAGRRLKQLQEIKNPGGNDIYPKQLGNYPSQGLMPANHPLATHLTMFVDVVMNQGTPEQIEKYGKPAEKCAIVGTYAQTELAHGTNVRGIETRADYDQKTDEFVLNTPNLYAYKWWPGGLGHTANHAMVVAQLYMNSEHKGVQLFIVPLRDTETHMPLPGIDIGEIGKKVGMHGTNQGYLGLKNVRIPRTNMLMKNAQVLPDGTFIESPASKLNYLTMVFTRCLIAHFSAIHLLEAATITTRYSAVRRQSPINPDEREPQILDHITQQYKVIPEIANGIAHYLCSQHLWEVYNLTLADIARGEYSGLVDLHIVSSLLKVWCTTDACAGIERLRLACGGHGYLAAANFGYIYGDTVAAYTYEGENTVLLLQVGRYLMKSWTKLTERKKLPQSVAYFQEFNRYTEFPWEWDGSWKCILSAIQYVATNKTRTAFENLSRRIACGATKPEAFNGTGIELVEAAQIHGRQLLVKNFINYIGGPKVANCSESLMNVLNDILELYLVNTTLNHMGDILRFIKISESQLKSLNNRLEETLGKLRPQAVAICDSFDFHDRVLNSVLGSYDGNVYERIFESAKRSPLNQKPVPDSFEKVLKPFMKSNL